MRIRWLIRKDVRRVLNIDFVSFDDYMREDDLIRFMRARRNIAIVAVDDDNEPIGFACYVLEKRKIVVPRMAVLPDYRRQGVGAAMITKLKRKLHPSRRRGLIVNVHEANLDGLRFLTACRFRAVTVVDDEYKMEYCVKTGVSG